MKKQFKQIAIAFTMLLTVSCTKTDRMENETFKDGHFEYSGGVWSSVEYRIEEKTIDSCQYIIIFGSENRNIIHKANCRNPIHLINQTK